MPGAPILVLGWRLGGQLCAVDAGKVSHIEPSLSLRRIPRPAPGVLGAGFYHGHAIPVFDFAHLLLGAADYEWPRSAVYLIIQDAGGMFAGRADGVERITQTTTDELKLADPKPGFPGSRFVRANLQIEGETALLIDFRRVLRHIGVEFAPRR